MPTARTIAGPRYARAAAPRISRADADRIIERRSELIDEIARLHQAGASPMSENAQQLLTRWWSRADWPAREQLLRTVQWLIEVERGRRAGARPSA